MPSRLGIAKDRPRNEVVSSADTSLHSVLPCARPHAELHPGDLGSCPFCARCHRESRGTTDNNAQNLTDRAPEDFAAYGRLWAGPLHGGTPPRLVARLPTGPVDADPVPRCVAYHIEPNPISGESKARPCRRSCQNSLNVTTQGMTPPTMSWDVNGIPIQRPGTSPSPSSLPNSPAEQHQHCPRGPCPCLPEPCAFLGPRLLSALRWTPLKSASLWAKDCTINVRVDRKCEN